PKNANLETKNSDYVEIKEKEALMKEEMRNRIFGNADMGNAYSNDLIDKVEALVEAVRKSRDLSASPPKYSNGSPNGKAKDKATEIQNRKDRPVSAIYATNQPNKRQLDSRNDDKDPVKDKLTKQQRYKQELDEQLKVKRQNSAKPPQKADKVEDDFSRNYN